MTQPNQRGASQDPDRTHEGPNIDPMKPPPTMQTLVYSPDVRVLIGHGNKQIEISRDIVGGTLIRKENAASTLFLTVTNKEGRYSSKISPMDRITVFMKRIRWVQVFSGYLDTVPFRQLYQGVITIKATCTLKRLLHTWWNPSLPASAQLFDQAGFMDATAGDGQVIDSGLGTMLANLLTRVGGWNRENIHIQNFPVSFYNFITAQINANVAANTSATMRFRRLLLGDDISGGAPMYADINPNAGAPGPPGVGAAFYVEQIIAACDEMGLGPLTIDSQNSQAVEQAAAEGMHSRDEASAKAWEQMLEAGQNWYANTQNTDAAILGVACAMAESGLRNLANAAVPDSLRFPNDGLSPDHDSVGLFQQRNFAEWGCLPAWSKIFTAHGPVDIVDVKPGDEVWSYDGERIALAKVTGWQMTGHKTLLTINTRGRRLEVTGNHRIPVRRYMGVKDGRRYGNQHTPSTCGWETIEIQARDIRPGDYLIIPHGMGDGTAVTDPDGNTLTVGIMELVGLYLGDGNTDNNGRTEIAHGTSGIHNDHMPHYRQVIRDELDVEPRVDKRRTRTRFNSPRFRKLIDEHFPGNCYTKRLPGWVFRLAPELQLALLRGYLDSDGSVDKMGRVSWTSVSENLIHDIRHLCIQLGIPVGNISRQAGKVATFSGQRNCSCSTNYTLRLTIPSLNAIIGSNSPHKAERLTTDKPQLTSVYHDDFNQSFCRRPPIGDPPENAVYHRVISIDEGDVEVPVYDIEVAGMAHYVADGIVVHNSVAQRMNPKQAARMFFAHLRQIEGWRNMDPGSAIYKVQRGGSPAYFAGFIPEATKMVQAARAAQTAATGLIGSNPLTSALDAGAGLAGFDIAKTVNAVANAATEGLDPIGARSLAGKPNPDSEGAINAAMSFLGTPYVWGGEQPGVGLDCSGMVDHAFRAIGINVGSWTGQQLAAGTPIDPRNAQRGDLLFPDSGHVGIYLGGGQWIDTGGPPGVKIGPIQKPLHLHYAARRICDNGGIDPTAPFVQGAVGPGAPPGTGQQTGVGGGSGGERSQLIARNLFSYIFDPALFANDVAVLWSTAGGHKEFIDAQPLIQMVQAVCKASLRNFQSAPNGDFIAYYPDHFGLEGKPAVMKLEDIELKDVHIDYSDDNLTTHVYVAGDPVLYGQTDQVLCWLDSAGTCSVEDEWSFQRMRKVGLGDFEFRDGAEFMKRYGVRPYQQFMPMVGSHELEFLLATQIFMEKWAAQYQTRCSFTFMPELLPGMRVEIGDHGLQLYVNEVIHEFNFENGFRTSAVMSAPSNPRAREAMADTKTAAPGPDLGFQSGNLFREFLG